MNFDYNLKFKVGNYQDTAAATPQNAQETQDAKENAKTSIFNDDDTAKKSDATKKETSYTAAKLYSIEEGPKNFMEAVDETIDYFKRLFGIDDGNEANEVNQSIYKEQAEDLKSQDKSKTKQLEEALKTLEERKQNTEMY